MTTFSIQEDASVGTSGVSAGVVSQVKANILAAAELWNRYFVQGNFDIKISLNFADLSGSSLASGGSGLTFFGGEGPGLEIWQVDSLEEFITGAEDGGSDVDITINVDTPLLLAGEFYFDPNPYLRTASVPAGKIDFMTVMLHELGHGLGYLSINDDGMDAVDNTDTSDSGFIDLTPYDAWIDPDAPGGRSFVGPNATAIFGGNIILDPSSPSHLASAADGGFENLMDPSLSSGTRSYIAPIHIAILEDIGMPIRKPTTGADVLFGFDQFDDDILLQSGNDTYDGLTGDDTVKGNDGNDTINGGAGNDDLRGSRDDDLLNGDDGTDYLRGNSGKDDLRGGADNDTLDGGTENDELRGDQGDDRLSGRFGRDYLSGGDDNDLLLGHNGGDTLEGDAGNDTLFGNPGNDLVDGGDDNDDVRGGNGNDLVEGGSGNDTLRGNSGNDTLNGGTGDDRVIGGAGDDVFQFSDGDDDDIVGDFTAGSGSEDVIELSGFGAAFDEFSEVLAAASNDGSGNTIIDFGGGDSITLLGVAVSELNASDFSFI